MSDASEAVSDRGGGATLAPQVRMPLWLVALLTFSRTLAQQIIIQDQTLLIVAEPESES
jgi:hypothetical protein